jgi:hypothetical protein
MDVIITCQGGDYTSEVFPKLKAENWTGYWIDAASTLRMGDLNDVAWSRTTRLFQRISGLLDPRVGRHFVNTFHADYPLLRWSLDHVFHSTDFALVQMQRLPHIGSDHFPVYVVLQTGRVFEQVQEELEQTEADEQEAQEAIEDGIEKAEREGKQVTDKIAKDYQ